MSSTVLADVNFASEIFKDTLNAVYTHKLGLLNSGLAVSIPDGIVSPNETGYLVDIPKWNILSGTWQQITTSTTQSVNNITDFVDKAAWMEREISFGADQMLKVVAGKDATEEIARQIGEFVALQVHDSMFACVKGVMASALASTHVHDKSSEIISREAIINAKGKLGDNADRLSICVMNSKVHRDAKLAQLAIDTPLADSITLNGNLQTLDGSVISVSNKLTPTAGVYPTLFGAPGALQYKFRNRPQNNFTNANIFNINAGNLIIQVELTRTTVGGGQDIITLRDSYLVHVPGVQHDATVTSNPTDAQLATSTTWTKVETDDNQIPLVELLTA